ncbi:hypothetical protein TNIN_235991 [Trichonephila inaurata madagascariensis]|uniref:Uncharacterized protein n=1 Tax=Trichonephila inaurata madagascariensis TaxID=2747483 RepID=A0A8X6XYV7_9ARAC|nr:hypothetical protein TNIN_235991 [Trichonephila inaurata madagascariensis]
MGRSRDAGFREAQGEYEKYEKATAGETQLEEEDSTTFTVLWSTDKQKTQGRWQQGRIDIQRRVISSGIQEEPKRGIRKDKSVSPLKPSRSQEGQVPIHSEAEQEPGRTSPYPLRSQAGSRRQGKEAATTSRERRTKSYNLRRRSDSRKSGFASTAESSFVMEKFTRRTSQRSASLKILSGDSTGSLKKRPGCIVFICSDKQSGHFCRKSSPV